MYEYSIKIAIVFSFASSSATRKKLEQNSADKFKIQICTQAVNTCGCAKINARVSMVEFTIAHLQDPNVLSLDLYPVFRKFSPSGQVNQCTMLTTIRTDLPISYVHVCLHITIQLLAIT